MIPGIYLYLVSILPIWPSVLELVPSYVEVIYVLSIQGQNILLTVTHGFLFDFETGSGSVAEAGLELSILLPQLPKWWDYRHGPQFPSIQWHWFPSWPPSHCNVTSCDFCASNMKILLIIFWSSQYLVFDSVLFMDYCVFAYVGFLF
jgi:hypothetical protein